MAVTVQEIQAPTFSVRQDGTTAKRYFRVPDWDDLEDFIDEFSGISVIIGDQVIPIGRATFPGKDWLLYDSAEIEPFDSDFVGSLNSDGVATGSDTDEEAGGAKVTITYKPAPYDENDDDDPDNRNLVTHSISGKGQFITLPLSGFEWEDAKDGGGKDLPPDILPGVPVGIIQHRMQWHDVANPPWSTIYDSINTVNNATFLSHPAETVMFSGFDASREYTEDGVRKWQLTYTFDARIINDAGNPGWNHFATGQHAGARWKRIVYIDNAAKLFPTKDFTALFEA